jgi:heat shock protein HtpX
MSLFGGRNRDDDNSSAGTILAVAGLVAMIISPIVAAMIQSAISRKREYLADASGALTYSISRRT